MLQSLRFDMTVTMGNVLTILAFMVASIAFGYRLEGRIKSAEESERRHEVWIAAHAACTRVQTEVMTELRAAIAYMRGRNGFHEHRRSEDIDD